MADVAEIAFNFTKFLVADLEKAAAFHNTVLGFQEWRRVDAGAAR
jgi:catechol 2,3-dioxygenase-like lactoylglutathione lyase family enzyme